jgi:Phospholipase_D-nuclease N-terminal
VIDELALASLLLASVALISCLSVEDKRTIRRMPRSLWVLVILLLPLAGPITWFLAGRPPTIRPARAGRLGMRGSREPPRPQAPDDDSEFLRSLDSRTVGPHEETLHQREEDLKPPEDE